VLSGFVLLIPIQAKCVQYAHKLVGPERSQAKVRLSGYQTIRAVRATLCRQRKRRLSRSVESSPPSQRCQVWTQIKSFTCSGRCHQIFPPAASETEALVRVRAFTDVCRRAGSAFKMRYVISYQHAGVHVALSNQRNHHGVRAGVAHIPMSRALGSRSSQRARPPASSHAS
jgi:hypothetical protein